MKIRKPAYFDQFQCLAGACPDSCCQEWDVQVDPQAAAMYRALQGELGDRLRQVLTDLADYLVKKGMPFRSAYKLSGQLVAKCIQDGCVLEDLPLETYRAFSDLFKEDIYQEIDLLTCVQKRISRGGTCIASVEQQLQYVQEKLQ